MPRIFNQLMRELSVWIGPVIINCPFFSWVLEWCENDEMLQNNSIDVAPKETVIFHSMFSIYVDVFIPITVVKLVQSWQ